MSSSSYDSGFNEGVRALTTMFPDIDPHTIRTVLDARDGHVESAVEKLLAMSRRGGGAGGGAAPGAMGMSPMSGHGSSDYYSNVPPPRQEEESLWGWLIGDDASGSSGTGNADVDETWNWISNQMSYLALEVSRQVKGVTDAIAEEILGPPEEEMGEEVEDITEEERERADVVAGGMAVQANRRTTGPKQEAPKPKPKRPTRHDLEDDDEDDALGGILNLLGLEDDLEDDELYVRRDSKKDK